MTYSEVKVTPSEPEVPIAVVDNVPVKREKKKKLNMENNAFAKKEEEVKPMVRRTVTKNQATLDRAKELNLDLQADPSKNPNHPLYKL